MSNDFARWGRMAAGAAALALLMGWTTSARADYAYAFSEQTLTNLRISGADPAGRGINLTTTTASNTLTGVSGQSNSDPTDTPQAYSANGGLPTPAQNLYTKFATGFSAPVPPSAGSQPSTVVGGAAINNFSRGDALFGPIGPPAVPTPVTATDLFGAGINVANVAEAYTTTGLGTGNGGWLLTAGFNTGASTAVSVLYGFANDLYTSVAGSGASAQAGFTFTYSVKTLAGVSVYEYASDITNSAQTNRTSGALPNSPEIVTSGVQTPAGGILITGLTANTGYSITFTGQESVNVRALVPAPTSIVMLGLGLGGLGLFRLRNRRVAG